MVMVLLIGAIIGLVLGLTGAGGSVLAVPLLVMVLHLPVQIAAGLSLGAVCTAAIFGVLLRARSGQVQWWPGVVFAVFGALFAPLGGWVSAHLDEQSLILSFTVLVFIVAVRMWRQASKLPQNAQAVRASSNVSGHEPQVPVCGDDALGFDNFRLSCFVRISLAAAFAGLLSGMYGVGGGFVIVPVLVALLRMDIRLAVATSLFVISVVSGAGFWAFALRTEFDFQVLSPLALGGLAGMLFGVLLSRWVAGPLLQKGFAALMPVIAVVMLLDHWQGL